MGSRFYIGVIPYPGSKDYLHTDGQMAAAASWWKNLGDLRRGIATMSEHEVYTDLRIGTDPRAPVGLSDERIEKKDSTPGPAPVPAEPPPAVFPAEPFWAEIVIGLASPALATALYKLLKTWIEAKAGREIKLKFGRWQAEFKGLSQRQVIKLFRALQEISLESDQPNESVGDLETETQRIAAILKELGVSAVQINPTKMVSDKRRKQETNKMSRIRHSSQREKGTKERRKPSK